jgi:hypothetical protein
VEGVDVPTLILLVGGPGNGKTEAVEATIGYLDKLTSKEGILSAAFAEQLAPAPGQPVPRVAPVTTSLRNGEAQSTLIAVVQDASVEDFSRPTKTAPELLLEELECFMEPGSGIYLACVNRGVLDDALILATDQKRDTTRQLLEATSRAVSMSAGAGSCWPLEGYPKVAIWPMDTESLLVPQVLGASPGEELFKVATDPVYWPAENSCSAGVRCPFCHSRKALASDIGRTALLNILRYHELGTGKRWSFRELLSLVPQLLAQVPEHAEQANMTPCEWAAEMLEIDRGAGGNRSQRVRSTAIYSLVGAAYEHVLFAGWRRDGVRQIQADIRDVGLADDRTLQGLAQFLRSSKHAALPSTLSPLLNGLSELLDPALASADELVQLSPTRSMRFGELDARFSQSVGSGLAFLIKHRCLSPMERDLLGRLEEIDAKLGGDIRISRPLASRRLQRTLREFASRLARRSVGAQHGAVRDRRVLQAFQAIVDAPQEDPDSLHAAAKSVEHLLNTDGQFHIALNTTFGEPLPPAPRRATLIAPKQRVRARPLSTQGRPRPPFRYLTIGSATNGQPVPLTYDLFKAVVDLADGMMQASLPATVVALLDSTRARLGGVLVRDPTLLEDATIRIGTAKEHIVKVPKGFAVERGDKE